MNGMNQVTRGLELSGPTLPSGQGERGRLIEPPVVNDLINHTYIMKSLAKALTKEVQGLLGCGSRSMPGAWCSATRDDRVSLGPLDLT